MENLYKLSDTELVNNIKRDNYSSESIEVLAERHGGLMNNVYNKYKGFFNSTGINIQELKQDCNIVIWQSAETFKEDKNSKFSSWLHNQINYQCLNAFNAHKKQKKQEVVFDDFNRLPIEIEIDNSEENLDKVKNIIEKHPDKRISKVFYHRYFDGNKKKNWKEIGKIIGFSSQTAINLHKSGLDFIKSNLESSDYEYNKA